MSDYTYKTKPYDHQHEIFTQTRDLDAWALFLEMGTGKSKIIADNAAYLFQQGKINALVVIAPNGIHANWTRNELPAHLPDGVFEQTYAHCYYSAKAGTKRAQRNASDLLTYGGLSVLVMSYGAMRTDRGLKLLKAVLGRRSCMLVLDESARIKTPSAKRTTRAMALAKYAPYRRILSGTPIANGPFDIYSQVRFLKADYWKQHRLATFEAFKAEFGVWARQKRTIRKKKRDGTIVKVEREVPQLVNVRNLDKLAKMVSAISSRVTKDQCLDLPPKLYSKCYFEISKEQRRVYTELADQYRTRLAGGEEIDVPNVLAQLLRFAQVASGYLPVEDIFDPSAQPAYVSIGKTNPRLDALENLLEDTPHQAIIWARFRQDIALICERLGSQAVCASNTPTIDCPVDERMAAMEAFQRGEYKYIVANPASMGEGYTLTAARAVVYFNNTFKLTDRLQSEDRAHRIGQEHPVLYTDIIAEDTVDERVVDALRNKRNIAAQITGDELGEWV